MASNIRPETQALIDEAEAVRKYFKTIMERDNSSFNKIYVTLEEINHISHRLEMAIKAIKCL